MDNWLHAIVVKIRVLADLWAAGAGVTVRRSAGSPFFRFGKAIIEGSASARAVSAGRTSRCDRAGRRSGVLRHLRKSLHKEVFKKIVETAGDERDLLAHAAAILNLPEETLLSALAESLNLPLIAVFHAVDPEQLPAGCGLSELRQAGAAVIVDGAGRQGIACIDPARLPRRLSSLNRYLASWRSIRQALDRSEVLYIARRAPCVQPAAPDSHAAGIIRTAAGFEESYSAGTGGAVGVDPPDDCPPCAPLPDGRPLTPEPTGPSAACAAEEDRLDVLIVDDDIDCACALSRTLTLAGYRARHSSSVTQALAYLEAGKPKAVISDMCMPHGGGTRLLLFLRQNQIKSQVLLLSGDEGERAAWFSLGASQVLLKPAEPEAVVEWVKQVLTDRP